MNEVTDINRALRPAITKDIADNGSAHAEEIDANLNSDAATQVAAMILSASLSLAVKGHMGLRREEAIEYLAAPNRKPEEFAQAFERLRKTAWYLHAEGELFYFKDTENLTKRIQREAQALPRAKVEKALRSRLEGELEARSRRAYQQVLVMPEIDQIQLTSHRVLVVVPPDNRVPPEDIQRFYNSVTDKNNLLVLSGNDTHMASRVEEALRELYAIENIAKNLKDSDALYAQAQDVKEEAEGALLQALQGTYNRLFYPSAEGLNPATIENGLKFGQTSENSVEHQIETLLASTRCDRKLALDAETNQLPYFAMAEEDLWPQSDRRTPWRDVLMRAKSNPAWPWLPGSKGLEQLKVKALSQGRWREGSDGWIEKGPFPKEKTAVNIVNQMTDPQAGETTFSLTPVQAGPSPRVHYSRSATVSESDPLVEDLDTFRTREPTLYFLAIDSTGQHEPGEPKRWVAKLKIQYQVHDRPDHREVELKVTPKAELHYTIDATNPREGRIYDGLIPISDDEILLQVYAQAGEATATETFKIPQKGIERRYLDEAKPARIVGERTRFDTTKAVYDVITQFKDRQGVLFHGVTLNVGEGEQAVTVRFNARSVTPAMLEKAIAALRDSLGEPDALVQLTIRDGADFPTGFDLKRFAEQAGLEIAAQTVEQ